MKKLVISFLIAVGLKAQTPSVYSVVNGVANQNINSATTVFFLNQNISAGNLASTPILTGTTSTAGLYRVSYYLAPVTSNALAVITGTIGFTDNGTAKTGSFSGLALLSLSNYIQGTMIIHCDASTNITFSDTVTSTAGSYSVYLVITKIG